MDHCQRYIIILTFFISSCRSGTLPVKEGDIIFQTLASPQSKAIQLATRSQYSHVGLILAHNDSLMVYEAIGPVKFTPIDSWVNRDPNRHCVVKRLKNAESVLTKANLAKLASAASTFEGRPYDSAFDWSDNKLYCSELVWKLFERTLKLNIGDLRKMKDFDLSSPEVQQKLKERYPGGIPLDETVISPEDIFQSGLLVTVYQQ